MADEVKPQSKWAKVIAYTGWGLAVAGIIVATVMAFKRGEPITIPTIPPFPEAGNFSKAPDGEVYTHGWVDDADARAESLARFPAVNFSATPAGKVAMGTDKDTFLFRAVRKAAGKGETVDWYPNVNQRSVGCCVGCGWKHAVDALSAVQIVFGKRAAEEWRPVSVEAIYGMSRVEYGKGRLNGDGSVGAWAREAVDKGGVAEMKKYKSADLTTFDPMRARQFGASGVPSDIEEAAKPQQVRGTALVRSWDEISKAIQQGYPIAVCSNVGFDDARGQVGSRDSQGFIRPRGTWNHCMMFCGVRYGDRPGVFCLNSWGDTAHGGTRWPADAPAAGFWIDADVAARMVSQGDSFALADLAGFPARPLDWDVRGPAPKQWVAELPKVRNKVHNPADVFALAP